VLVARQRAEGSSFRSKSVRIDPLHARPRGRAFLDDISRERVVDRVVAVALEGIPDQILKLKSDVPRLARMEIPQAADLPSVHQIAEPPMGPRRLGHLVANACGEEMPRIVIA